MHEMPTMDVSEELHLSSCQQGFCVPKEVLQQIVIDAQGSLPVAIGVLHRWSQQPYAQDHDYCTEFKSRSGPCLLQPRISGGGASTGNMSDTSHARHSGGIDISSQQWCIQTQPGVASGGAGDTSSAQIICMRWHGRHSSAQQQPLCFQRRMLSTAMQILVLQF